MSLAMLLSPHGTFNTSHQPFLASLYADWANKSVVRGDRNANVSAVNNINDLLQLPTPAPGGHSASVTEVSVTHGAGTLPRSVLIGRIVNGRTFTQFFEVFGVFEVLAGLKIGARTYASNDLRKITTIVDRRRVTYGTRPIQHVFNNGLLGVGLVDMHQRKPIRLDGHRIVISACVDGVENSSISDHLLHSLGHGH